MEPGGNKRELEPSRLEPDWARHRGRAPRSACCCRSKQCNLTPPPPAKTLGPLRASRSGGDNANALMRRPPSLRQHRRRRRWRWARTRPGVGELLASAMLLALLNLIPLEPIGSASASEHTDSMIKVTRFQVPSQVRPGETRRLTCQYDLRGFTLHALKLFKDDKEFYRYTPIDSKLTFPVLGVHVDQNKSNDHDVWLRINKRSSGQYRCQVSIEGTFNSVSAERRMEVVDPSQMATSGASANAGHLAGAGAWQHQLISQQHQQHQQHQQQLQESSHQGGTRVRLAQSSVKQNPSQLYGLSAAGLGRSGSPPLNWFGPSSLTLGALVALISQLWTQARGHDPRSRPAAGQPP